MINEHPEVVAIDVELASVRAAKAVLLGNAVEARDVHAAQLEVWHTACGAAAREGGPVPGPPPVFDGTGYDVALGLLQDDENGLKNRRVEAIVAAAPEFEAQARDRLYELEAKSFPWAKKLLDNLNEANLLLADVRQAREFADRDSNVESVARPGFRSRSQLTPVDWFAAVIAGENLMALTDLPGRVGEILNDTQAPTFDDKAPLDVFKMQTSGLGDRPEEMPRQARSARGVEI